MELVLGVLVALILAVAWAMRSRIGESEDDTDPDQDKDEGAHSADEEDHRDIRVDLTTGEVTLSKPWNADFDEPWIPPLSTDADRPAGWALKCGWLAIKGEDIQAVMDALGLLERQPANWQSGVDWVEMYPLELTPEIGDPVFVAPAVDGWVLVLGPWTAVEIKDGCRATLEPLSKRFGDAQAFATYSKTDTHGWARAVDGNLLRRVFWNDGAMETEGQITQGEETFWSSVMGKTLPTSETKFSAAFQVEENHPHKIAEAWSTDPARFEARTDLDAYKSLGFVGLMPRRTT